MTDKQYTTGAPRPINAAFTDTSVQTNPFEIDGIAFGSVEAFARTILIPENDPRRDRIRPLDQLAAKYGEDDSRDGLPKKPTHGHWAGRSFELGSTEHKTLMRGAVESFRTANPNWETLRSQEKALPRPPQRKRSARKLPEQSDLVVNVGIDLQAELLSNFAHTPFVLNDKRFASAEAFVQYIKYPENVIGKEEICELTGKYAKRRGRHANRYIEAKSFAQGGSFRGIYVYWQSKQISYRSKQHTELIQKALFEKFARNAEARKQLLATGNKPIIHDLGYPESAYTSLPTREFTRILTELRDYFAAKPTKP